jgi:hypothetical protein
MALPIAMFLEESTAKEWAQKEYRNQAEVKKYPASSLFLEALHQC